MREIGAKSLTWSYGSLLYSAGLTPCEAF